MEDSLYALKQWFRDSKNVYKALTEHYDGFEFGEGEYAIRFTPNTVRKKHGYVKAEKDIPPEEMDEWEHSQFIVVIHDSSGRGLKDTVKIKGYVWSPGMDFQNKEEKQNVEDAFSNDLYDQLVVGQVGIPESEEKLNEYMENDDLFMDAIEGHLDQFSIEGHPVETVSLTGNGLKMSTSITLTGEEDYAEDVEPLLHKMRASSDEKVEYEVEYEAGGEVEVSTATVPKSFRIKETVRYEKTPWDAEEFEWCLRNLLDVDEPILLEEAEEPEY